MTQYPTKAGFYGSFGGQFVPETLMYAVKQVFKLNYRNIYKSM